jgi:site-specific recombinase XerD
LKLKDVDFGRGVVVCRERKNDDDAQIVLTPNVQAVPKRYPEKARPKLLKRVKNPEYADYFILTRSGRPFHRGPSPT